MGQSHHEQWQHLYQQKSHSFLEEKCYRASGVTDMAKLQASFSDLERLYRLQHFSDIVRAFQPSLANVKSFTLVISSVTHGVHVPGLVWGALQTAVEVWTKPSALQKVHTLADYSNRFSSLLVDVLTFWKKSSSCYQSSTTLFLKFMNSMT